MSEASDDGFKPKTQDGEFVRGVSGFRNWITADGSTGPTGDGGFKAEAGRYHLYISHACPWANRAMIFRKLKGLEALISVDVVHPLMGPQSWHFGEYPGSTADSVNGCETMKAVYAIADANFDGTVTVPLLWDKKLKTAVNNESSEIIRMFNSAFNELTGDQQDYYPSQYRSEIDTLNEKIYDSLNNGVYRSGFASTQSAYEKAVTELFETLDFLEAHLQNRTWLAGEQATEADWRLFVTLIRFDAVYHGHFKCNLRRIRDYPALNAYTHRLYHYPGISDTINFDQIKYHYYASHTSINPTAIVPIGPANEFDMGSEQHL